MTISRTPLSRKTTMDQTIEEGLNFLRSGGATIDADHFPLTLGKRHKVSRKSLTRTPSPKRARKSPPKYKPEKSEKIKSTPKKSTPKPKKSAIRKATKKAPAPKKVPTRKTTTTFGGFGASTQKTYCPPNFNGGKFNFDDLNEFKCRKMKETGTDERITEIVFSFDTTGSMGNAINEAKKNIVEITNRLFDTVTGLRIGIIAHGDYCDSAAAVFQVKELSSDKEKIIEWISNVTLGGGGDAPENYEEVLEYCNESMNWTKGSHRVLVMIGDQVPHEPEETFQQMKSYNRPNPRAIDWREQVDKCWENGIKIYGVQANCSNQEYVRYYYESLATRTCGTRVELNNFPMVTDMLLMVCFREADRIAFNDFRDEVQREGRMDKERTEMFDKVSK